MQKKPVFLLNPNNADILSGDRRTPNAPTKMQPGLKWFLIIAGVGYLMLTLFGAVWMVTELADWSTLNTRGILVEGQLTGRDTNVISSLNPSMVDPDPNRRRTVYYWEYSYITNDGQRFEGEAQVTEDAYNAYRSGMSVQVRYLEDAPQTSYLIEEGAFSFPRIPVIAGGGNALLVFVVLFIGLRDVRQQRRYQRDGRIIDGWVVNPNLQVGESDGKRIARLYMNYRITSPVTGQDIHRVQDQQRNDLTEADLPPEGSRLAVLYVDDRLFTLL